MWLFKGKDWEQKCSFSSINSITTNKKQMEYYTYAYLREDGTPYYIGKGSGKRIYKKTKNEIKPPKDKSRIIFLKQNLIEEEAFKHEIYMIAVFGRKDLGTGILYNRTDGGDGSSGAIRSLELRNKISKSLKDRTFTPEHLEKISKSLKGNVISEETKQKISDKLKGRKLSEATKQKMSESRKGRIFTEETKEKLSRAKKGRAFNLKKYAIIDDVGNKYSISSGLRNFCMQHKISYDTMYYGLHFRNGICTNGWKIEYE